MTRAIFNDSFYLKKKQYDISSTYDGFTIVSDNFYKFCVEKKWPGISFHQIPNHPKYSHPFYLMEIESIVYVDVEASRPEFGPVCKKCMAPQYVVGAVNYYLSPMRHVLDGFWRTDLEFADGVEKSYIIIVGTEAVDIIKKRKFKGACFESIEA